MFKLLKTLVPLLILAGLITAGYFYWQHTRLYPSTDDAYVQADTINIAPRVTGKVVHVFVQDNEFVHQGQPLFDVDPTSYQIAVAQAQAQLDETIQQIKAASMAIESAQTIVTQRQAELADTLSDTQRVLIMAKKHYYSQAQQDLAIKNLRVAKAALATANSQLAEAIQTRGDPGPTNAQLRAAEAALAQTKLDLHNTHIVAPADGYIANFDLRTGAVATAYHPLFALIEDQRWWVQANFKETQLQRIAPGQQATIANDMYPHQIFRGMVHSISDGSGSSFSLLPPENASGNWVKVTQRFPVKVIITTRYAKYPLRLGASCTVTVNTTPPASAT